MNSPVKRPGEVWWAYHPWLSRVEFWNKDGSKVTTRSMQHDKPSHVHIACKPHPALILAPGDEKGRGYLVCYLSGQSLHEDEIPRRLLKGVRLNDVKDTYAFSMAPCYCDGDFIWGSHPLQTADRGMLELVKGILKRSCRLMGGQSWEAFGFDEIEPEIAADQIDEVRAGVRELLDAIRHADSPEQPITEPRPERRRAADPDREFDAALSSALAAGDA
jgi:hypothetical protein